MHLVFHSAALGDFVLLMPLLRRLPGGLTLVCDWQRGELAEKLLADRAGVYESLDDTMIEFTRLFAEGGPSAVSPMVRDAFDAAETVISFVAEAGSAWATNIDQLCPDAKLVFAPTKPAPASPASSSPPEASSGRDGDAVAKPSRGKHITTIMAEVVAAGGVELAEPSRPEHLDDADFDAAAIQSWIVHPGSGGAAKRWPLTNVATLVERLKAAGKRVRVLCGHVEMEAAEKSEDDRAALSAMDGEVVPHLPGLVALLEQAKADGKTGYLGMDAGPTHLAAAIGLPTLALFGPSDATVWRPVGERVRVIAPPEPTAMDWLSTEHLARALGCP